MSYETEDQYKTEDEDQLMYDKIMSNIEILDELIKSKCLFNLDKIERTIDELIELRRHCEPKHCEQIDDKFLKINKLLNKEQLDRIFKKIFNYKSDRVSNNTAANKKTKEEEMKKKMQELFTKGGKTKHYNKTKQNRRCKSKRHCRIRRK